MKHKSEYLIFDAFRGGAALIVAFAHLRSLFFGDYVFSSSGFIAKSFFFISGYAHQAVMIFFVLSGFFIAGSIDRNYTSGRFSIKKYAFDRLSRLWIVLIPALILCLLMGLIVQYSGSPFKQHIIELLPDIAPDGRLDIFTFFGNMFFLQKITVETYACNGALWSLTNEFWYYVLFPILYFIFKPNSIKLKLILIIALIGISTFIGMDILKYFSVWLMGAAAYYLIEVKKIKVKKAQGLVFTGIFILSLALRWHNVCPIISNDYILGLSFAGLLVYLSESNANLHRIAGTIKFISDISYSVYLIHLPIAVTLAVLFFNNDSEFSLINFGFYLIYSMIVLLISYAFYYCFERKTELIKNKLKAIFKLKF